MGEHEGWYNKVKCNEEPSQIPYNMDTFEKQKWNLWNCKTPVCYIITEPEIAIFKYHLE